MLEFLCHCGFGLLGGLTAGWILEKRATAKRRREWELRTGLKYQKEIE